MVRESAARERRWLGQAPEQQRSMAQHEQSPAIALPRQAAPAMRRLTLGRIGDNLRRVGSSAIGCRPALIHLRDRPVGYRERLGAPMA